MLELRVIKWIQQAPRVWMTLSSHNESNWQASLGHIPLLWKYSRLSDSSQCTVLSLTGGRITRLWDKPLHKADVLSVKKRWAICMWTWIELIRWSSFWQPAERFSVQVFQVLNLGTDMIGRKETRHEWGTEVRGLGNREDAEHVHCQKWVKKVSWKDTLSLLKKCACILSILDPSYCCYSSWH